METGAPGMSCTITKLDRCKSPSQKNGPQEIRLRLLAEYIPSGTGLAGTSNGIILHPLDCLIVFFFSSLCQVELSVMKGVLSNWQLAGKSAG
jgi:hypothetical protein